MTTCEQQIREDAAEAMRRADAEDEVLLRSFPSRHTPPQSEEGERCHDVHEETTALPMKPSSSTDKEINAAAAEAMRVADEQ